MRTAYTKTSGVVRADGESGTTGIEYPRNLCKVGRSTLVESTFGNKGRRGGRSVLFLVINDGDGT